MTTHPVANDQQGIQARLVPPNDYGVLVLLSFEAGISRPGDPQTQGLRPEEREMNCVLTDRDAVVVLELFLLDRLAVDQRAVGAPQIDDPELVAATFHASVMPAGRRVAKDQVVVGRTPHSQRALGGAVRMAGVGT